MLETWSTWPRYEMLHVLCILLSENLAIRVKYSIPRLGVETITFFVMKSTLLSVNTYSHWKSGWTSVFHFPHTKFQAPHQVSTAGSLRGIWEFFIVLYWSTEATGFHSVALLNSPHIKVHRLSLMARMPFWCLWPCFFLSFYKVRAESKDIFTYICLVTTINVLGFYRRQIFLCKFYTTNLVNNYCSAWNLWYHFDVLNEWKCQSLPMVWVYVFNFTALPTTYFL